MFDGCSTILCFLIDGRVFKMLSLAFLMSGKIRTAHYLMIEANQITLFHKMRFLCSLIDTAK